MSNYPCPGYQIQRDLKEQERKLNSRLDDLERTLQKLIRQVSGVDVALSEICRELDGVRDLAHKIRVWGE